MRGVVLGIVQDGTYGQLSAEDGQRYSYWTSEVRNGPVQVGQKVEFQMWEGQPVNIFVVQAPAPPQAAPPQRPGMGQPRMSGGPARAATGAQQGYAAGSAALGAAMAKAGAIPSSDNYWVNLFTTADGRLARKQFWLHGVLPIIGASIVLKILVYIALIVMPLTMILFANLVVFLVLLWPQFCISSKRFHDVGYPGWYNFFWIVPFFLAELLSSLDLFLYNFAYLLYIVSLILSSIGALVALAALIVVYIRVGQEGPNQYGPDPLAV